MQLSLHGGVLAPALPARGQERGSSRHTTGAQGSASRGGTGPPATPRASVLPNRQRGAWLHVWRDCGGCVSPVSLSHTRMGRDCQGIQPCEGAQRCGEGACSQRASTPLLSTPAPRLWVRCWALPAWALHRLPTCPCPHPLPSPSWPSSGSPGEAQSRPAHAVSLLCGSPPPWPPPSSPQPPPALLLPGRGQQTRGLASPLRCAATGGVPGQGAAEAVEEEVQEVLGRAEVAEGVQELLHVALQEGVAAQRGPSDHRASPVPQARGRPRPPQPWLGVLGGQCVRERV